MAVTKVKMKLRKYCQHCNRVLVRRRRRDGRLENARDFDRRDFCNDLCRYQHRHGGCDPTPEQIKLATARIRAGWDAATEINRRVCGPPLPCDVCRARVPGCEQRHKPAEST